MPIPVSIHTPNKKLLGVARVPILGGVVILFIGLILPVGLGLGLSAVLVKLNLIAQSDSNEMMLSAPFIMLSYYLVKKTANTTTKIFWMPSWILGLILFLVGASKILEL